MKWKTALTADEAAMMAVGIDGYATLDKYKSRLPLPSCLFGLEKFSQEDWDNGSAQATIDKENMLWDKCDEAGDIREALLEEILWADAYDRGYGQIKSCLEIAKRVQQSEFDDSIACEVSTITKASLARWFQERDPEMAKLFAVGATKSDTLKANEDNATPLATKSKNAYLKTIGALVEALIGKPTGRPNTDAEAVLAALANQSVEAPVSKKKLAAYIDEASNL